MQKKKTLIITFIIFTFVLGGLLGAYYIFIADDSDTATDASDSGIKNIFDTFFPFGDESATDEMGTAEDTLDDTGTSAPVPRLRQVSSFPTAGAIALYDKESDETLIRFIARETGHIYETTTDSLTQKRVSNTTIPRVQNALWASNGEELIIQYLDDEGEQVESFYAALDMGEENTESSGGSLVGTFLPKNITALALSLDSDKLFYLTESGNGSIGIVSDLDGGGKVQVFDSPLSQWLVEWQRGDTIALTTKPSSNTEGFLYFLNSKTEKFNKILDSNKGLTASMSPDRKKVLFSHNTGSFSLLSVLNVNTGRVRDLPLWTLPEKCVWSDIDSTLVYCGVPNTVPSGNYLDLWYQGLISFSDSVWVIDTEESTTDLIVEPQDEVQRDLDITNLSLSPDEDHLLFIDKKDSTLWSLQLE